MASYVGYSDEDEFWKLENQVTTAKNIKIGQIFARAVMFSFIVMKRLKFSFRYIFGDDI